MGKRKREPEEHPTGGAQPTVKQEAANPPPAAVASGLFAAAVGKQHGPAAAVAAAVGVTARQASAAIHLLKEEQASLPFIARYRKEATQGLDETQLR